MAHPLINEVGNRYGKLIVTKRVENKKGHPQFLCVCDCGGEAVVQGSVLRRGFANSCGCLRKLPEGEGSFRALYRYTVWNARYREIEWGLDKDFFRWITKQNCAYCGVEPSQEYGVDKPHHKHNGKYIYNGIDRVDNTVGYIPENCAPCCGYCNWMKSAAGVDEFREWVIQVYNHWASKS